MRKLLVVALVCAGFVGAGQIFEASTLDKESRLAAVTRILTGSSYEAPTGTQTAPVPAALPVPSVSMPGAQLLLPPASIETETASSQESSSPARELVTSSDAVSSSNADSPRTIPEPPVSASRAASWPTVVVSEGTPVVTPATPPSTRPTSASERYELVTSLQKELVRAGCYGGRIDGSWRKATKRAMHAFMERVNASLPVESPDYILLTLLQAHPANVCGRGCSKGETLAADGRCLPNAIVARASKTKQAPTPAAKPGTSEAVVAWPAEGASVALQAPFSGRMSVGGPLPAVDGPKVRALGSSSSAPSSTVPGTDNAAARFETAALAEDAEPTTVTGISEDPRQPSKQATSKSGSTSGVKPGRPNKQRNASRARYRHVQNLFTHPLGRM